MPKRWCQCRGCASCGSAGRAHGALFDADATGTLRCPGCQAVATTRRNARPSSTSRGYDGEYERNRPAVVARARQGEPCYICKQPVTPAQKVTVEHKTPRRNGGGNEPANLAPAHAWCNTAWNKGTKR